MSLSHQWPEKNIAARKDYLMALCDVPQSITGKTQITGKTPAERPRTRRDRGGSTKEKLILAAIALSAQRGFSNVPLREVVEKAECHNISAVHYHFKNRNGLLEAILQAIDKHWAVDIPAYAQRGGVFEILQAFALSLDDLKRAAQWGNTVIKFLTRLAMDDEPDTAEAATGFLAARLSAVYDAIAPLCPDAPAAALRLKVSNACLLLLTMSSHLDRSCMIALGCDNLVEVKESLLRETVMMAAAIIQGIEPEDAEEAAGAEKWANEPSRLAVRELASAGHQAEPGRALA